MDTDSTLTSPFFVREGFLVSAGEPRGHLITEAEFQDYRLEAEYRFPGEPGNAGVLVDMRLRIGHCMTCFPSRWRCR